LLHPHVSFRLIVPILAPAIWSALAIGFAESISDFGVAATLAYNSNFPLATYQLYAAIGNFPPDFPVAAAMGWLLVAAVAIPLALQARALRGRSYAILSGRTRQAVRRQLGFRSSAAAAGGGLVSPIVRSLFYGIVVGAGYIFAYNLPIMSRLGINLYQTVTLLLIAYAAASLPTTARCWSSRLLAGRVTDVAFRGRGYEHAIDIDEGIRLTGVFARMRAARGETVGLRLDPVGCHLFPADE
jgi:ABC-type Fe3+ transport system permease subunit